MTSPGLFAAPDLASFTVKVDGKDIRRQPIQVGSRRGHHPREGPTRSPDGLGYTMTTTVGIDGTNRPQARKVVDHRIRPLRTRPNARTTPQSVHQPTVNSALKRLDHAVAETLLMHQQSALSTTDVTSQQESKLYRLVERDDTKSSFCSRTTVTQLSKTCTSTMSCQQTSKLPIGTFVVLAATSEPIAR